VTLALLQHFHGALAMCALPSFLKFPFLASGKKQDKKLISTRTEIRGLNFLFDHTAKCPALLCVSVSSWMSCRLLKDIRKR